MGKTENAFASWAPPALRELHFQFSMNAPKHLYFMPPASQDPMWVPEWFRSLSTNDEMSELVKRWATHPAMESAWKKIGAKTGDQLDQAARCICLVAISAIALHRDDSRVTKGQQRKTLNCIAETLEMLRTQMAASPEFRNANISDFLPEEDFRRLQHNYVHVSFSDADRPSVLTKRVDVPFKVLKFSAEVSLPGGVDALFGSMAAKAVAYAAEPNLPSSRPGKSAETAAMRDALSEFFTKKFGEPMDDVVATFVQAAYPKLTVRPDTIAKARRRKPSPRP